MASFPVVPTTITGSRQLRSRALLTTSSNLASELAGLLHLAGLGVSIQLIKCQVTSFTSSSYMVHVVSASSESESRHAHMFLLHVFCVDLL